MDIVPYKTKMTERIRLVPKTVRSRKLKAACYNLFFLNSEDVYIDLLTDSGTGAMSDEQWAGVMLGNESYAGSPSFRKKLKKAVKDVLGFSYVIPVHQGRGAENVVNETLVKPGFLVPGNAHFDTTKAHIRHRGGVPVNCTIAEAYDNAEDHLFKGNVDLERLESLLKIHRIYISYILITITCNQVGGQPVSMENIRRVSELAQRYGIKLFFDGARCAENAFFIKEREPGYRRKSIKEIIKEMMGHVDGMLMSAKKDAIVPIGGLIALKDRALYEQLSPFAVVFEGGLEYGGMSGANMEALAQGLYEGIGEQYLRYKVSQIKYLADRLSEIGVPVLKPGGHAVYVDAGKFLPHMQWEQFPGHALAIALYLEGGVRSVEVGSLMEGRNRSGKNQKAKMELLRLAIPARVYSKEHLDHVVETFKIVLKKKDSLRGVEFAYEPPVLRHFSSKFSLLQS